MCLQRDPARRPPAELLQLHPWVLGFTMEDERTNRMILDWEFEAEAKAGDVAATGSTIEASATDGTQAKA